MRTILRIQSKLSARKSISKIKSQWAHRVIKNQISVTHLRRKKYKIRVNQVSPKWTTRTVQRASQCQVSAMHSMKNRKFRTWTILSITSSKLTGCTSSSNRTHSADWNVQVDYLKDKWTPNGSWCWGCRHRICSCRTLIFNKYAK